MKFRCERQALADALGTAVRASGGRTASSPALAGVRLEVKGDTLTIACTDSDQIINCSVPVQGITNGISVPRAKLLNEIVRSLSDGAVELEVVGEDIVVRGGRSSFNVPTYMAQDFQMLPPAAAPDTKVNAKEFAEALRQVGPARRMGSDDNKFTKFNGIQISHDADGIWVSATDGYRMALRSLPHSDIIGVGEHLIVPGDALSELTGMLSNVSELIVRWADPTITFIAGSATLTTRTITGQLPDAAMFRTMSYDNVLTINRDKFLEALRRARIVLPARRGLRLHCGPGGVRIEAADRDLGRIDEDLEGNYVGDEIMVSFNIDYLISAVEVVDTEDVRILAGDPRKQVIVRAADSDDYSCYIMPIKA